MEKAADSEVLIVYLDGTLIKTDLLFEQAWKLVRTNPSLIFGLIMKAFSGPAALKQFVLKSTTFDAQNLPMNEKLLGVLAQRQSEGTDVYLVSASPEPWVASVAGQLNIFKGFAGSQPDLNLKGLNKLKYIQGLGFKSFGYFGDSSADLPIWAAASEIFVVNPKMSLRPHLKKLKKSYELIEDSKPLPKVLFKQLRVHQWVKNALLFLPLLGSHQFSQLGKVYSGLIGIVSFSLVASFVYVFNDICDLEADRKHRKKKFRPLASGDLDIRLGLVLLPILLIGGLALGYFLSTNFFYFLLLYFAINLAYSFKLKKVLVLDVILLASMYTIRVLAGGQATDTFVSDWMLSFCTFFFFSLAAVKRCSEIQKQTEGAIHGRAYEYQDYQVMTSLGVGAGLMSILIFLLYLQSEQIKMLYKSPHFLWLATPGLLYFIARIWILVGREVVDEDPVIFAIKDRVSWALLFYLLLVLAMAAS